MILVEVQRPFNVRFRGGRTLSLHPGQRVQVPEGKVGELVKRGWRGSSAVLMKGPPATGASSQIEMETFRKPFRPVTESWIQSS